MPARSRKFTRTPSVVIADPNTLIAEAFAYCLTASGRFNTTLVSDLLDLKCELRISPPDLMIVSTSLPWLQDDDTILGLAKTNRAVGIALLAPSDAGLSEDRVFASGASGLLLMDQPLSEIMEALDILVDGGTFYPRRVNPPRPHMLARVIVPVHLRN